MALTEDDTGDHEALAAWLGADAGEAAPRIRSHRPRAPGRLLLCTDGLWRFLPDAASLQDVLTRPPRPGDLRDQVRTLVEYALNAGGRDDITAVLIRRPADAAGADRPGG
jgi:serine/threonine protein phosphatase PrpC